MMQVPIVNCTEVWDCANKVALGDVREYELKVSLFIGGLWKCLKVEATLDVLLREIFNPSLVGLLFLLCTVLISC